MNQNTTYSYQIVHLHLLHKNKFLYLIKNLCPSLKITKEIETFIEKLRKIIINDLEISQKLRSFSQLKFTELPQFLFINQVSTKYRQVRTVNGYDMDIVKSAMQKYARRGLPEYCLYAMIEMNFFHFIDGGKSSFTNFYNRIRVILLEDVGIASPLAIPIADKLLSKLKTTESNFTEVLPQLAWLLSNSLHHRTFSMVRAYYYKYPPQPEQSKMKRFDLKNDEDLRISVDSLIGCLERKSMDSYYWMTTIYNGDKLKSSRYNRSQPGFLVLAILEWYFNQIKVNQVIIENLKVCREWLKTLKIKEAEICVFHPMALYIMSDNLDFSQNTYLLERDSYLEYWNKNLLNIKMDFHSYVHDMHTKSGRTQGKDSVDFAIEGSLVAFEDMKIEDIEARYLYSNNKIQNGTVPDETDLFTMKARAQLTCGDSKTDVYYAKERQDNVVVKGPYLDYYSANKSYQISRLLSLFEEINSLEINIRIAVPNLFSNVPLGIRKKIDKDTPYYFLVFKDLYDLEEYPTMIKSSKVWKEEEVVDYQKLFENTHIGFGVASEMTEEAQISYLYQLAIRYTFEIGDFCNRNFIRVGNKVWNLDTEGMFIGNKNKMKQVERNILLATYRKNKEKITQVLTSWLNPVSSKNPSFYNRWFMVKRVMNLNNKQLEQTRNNLLYLINNYEEWIQS
jgi:hypothetical protein